MSVASFLARFAKTSTVQPIVKVKASGPLEPGSRVELDGVSGTVAFIDGDRVVWTEDGGAVHMTLPTYLQHL